MLVEIMAIKNIGGGKMNFKENHREVLEEICRCIGKNFEDIEIYRANEKEFSIEASKNLKTNMELVFIGKKQGYSNTSALFGMIKFSK